MNTADNEQNKLAFFFPGQGSQYIGMGKNLCIGHAEAREAFEEASDALGQDIKKLCWESDLAELSRTQNSQPAILTCSVAMFRTYMPGAAHRPPSFMLGHSLGEFSALTCAGALSLSEAVKLVAERGRLMQDAIPVGVGGMTAISGLTEDKVRAACQEIAMDGTPIELSLVNSHDQIVLSGLSDNLPKIEDKLKAMGARIARLKVSAPFHCSLMNPAAERFKGVLSGIKLSAPRWPIISNVTALPYENAGAIRDALISQMTHTVQWRKSVKYVETMGVATGIEFGPGSVLKNLIMRGSGSWRILSSDIESDSGEIIKLLNGAVMPVANAMGPHFFLGRCLALAASARNMNYDEKEYRSGVVLPYAGIKELLQKVKAEKRPLTESEMRAGLEMLRKVLETKKVPVQERKDRFSQLLMETGTQTLFASINQ